MKCIKCTTRDSHHGAVVDVMIKTEAIVSMKNRSLNHTRAPQFHRTEVDLVGGETLVIHGTVNELMSAISSQEKSGHEIEEVHTELVVWHEAE